MKKTKLLLTTLFFFLCAVTFAQIRKVPAEVTNAFAEKFKDAKNVEWKDNVTNFEARFKMNSYDLSAYYNGKGEWQGTDTKMPYGDLPSAVKEGFGVLKISQFR